MSPWFRRLPPLTWARPFARQLGLAPVLTSPPPSELTVVNGALFFSVNDGSRGSELWKHDPAMGGHGHSTSIQDNVFFGGIGEIDQNVEGATGDTVADMANGPKPHNLQYPETTAFLVWAPACRKPTSQVTNSLASSGVFFSEARG